MSTVDAIAVLAERAAKQHEERMAWADRWPDHCPDCEGSGCFTSSCSEEADPCDTCQYPPCRCPRCAHPGVSLFDRKPCPGCGWTYGGPDFAMPPGYLIWQLESERAWAAGELNDPFADEVTK